MIENNNDWRRRNEDGIDARQTLSKWFGGCVRNGFVCDEYTPCEKDVEANGLNWNVTWRCLMLAWQSNWKLWLFIWFLGASPLTPWHKHLPTMLSAGFVNENREIEWKLQFNFNVDVSQYEREKSCLFSNFNFRIFSILLAFAFAAQIHCAILLTAITRFD